MGRRYRNRQQDDSILDTIFDLLKMAPIWVGPVMAVAVFILLHYVFPLLMPAKQSGVDAGILWRPLFSMLSWVFAGAVLLAWVMAEVWKLFNRRLLDSQSGIESIRTLSWQEFERLIGEAYRRKGYVAEVVGSPSGDGGVDIELHGQGQFLVIQCKHWKAYSVGVREVRELLGVVTSRKADGAILVTSGRFTEEARRFAGGNPIELLDGGEVSRLIAEAQKTSTPQPPGEPSQAVPVTTGSPKGTATSGSPVSEPSPLCPRCGKAMVKKLARRGRNAGNEFWSCSAFPQCNGARSIAGQQQRPRRRPAIEPVEGRRMI